MMQECFPPHQYAYPAVARATEDKVYERSALQEEAYQQVEIERVLEEGIQDSDKNPYENH